ncbi:MAG: hypothetical protein ACE5F1_15960 [Planctomycetota bacterium]
MLGATERELAPERYLAGLIILRNMIFMKTTRKGRKIDVELVDLLGNPVAGAMTQLIHVLNGHEAQEGKATDGQGKTTFFVEAVTEVRWDFFQGRYAVPELDPKTEPVEIHAHDAATGSQCFVTV